MASPDEHPVDRPHDERIFHITKRSSWELFPDRPFVDRSLEAEGFIHCSRRDQVLIPANGLFRGQPDLVLVVIETTKLTSPVVYEDCYQSGMEFPHIYGPLDRAAVVAVVDFPCRSDGGFDLPEPLK